MNKNTWVVRVVSGGSEPEIFWVSNAGQEVFTLSRDSSEQLLMTRKISKYVRAKLLLSHPYYSVEAINTALVTRP